MDLQKFTVTASAAFPISYPGSYVYFQEITTGSNTSRIKLTTNNGDKAYLKQGQGTNLPPFRELTVERDSGSATIAGELDIGDGNFTDNRTSGNVNTLPTAVDYTHAAITAGAASSTALAANSNRRAVSIQNQSATEDVFLNFAGAVAVASNAHYRLRAGETWEPYVPPTGAITCIRGAATDVSLHVTEGA